MWPQKETKKSNSVIKVGDSTNILQSCCKVPRNNIYNKHSGVKTSFSITSFELILLKLTTLNLLAMTCFTTGESGWLAERPQWTGLTLDCRTQLIVGEVGCLRARKELILFFISLVRWWQSRKGGSESSSSLSSGPSLFSASEWWWEACSQV